MLPSLPQLMRRLRLYLSNTSKNLVLIAAVVVFLVLVIIPRTTNTTNTTTTTTTTNDSEKTTEAQQQQQQPVAAGGSSSSSSSSSHELFYRLLISACVTILYEMLLGHPLDLLKIHMQTSNESSSYRQAIANIIQKRDNGVWAMWDGFLPFGILQSATKGGAFGMAHATWTKILAHLLGTERIKTSQWARTLAGALAGAVQGYCMTPTLLLKTRVITRASNKNTNHDNDNDEPPSSAAYSWTQSCRVVWDILRNEGGVMALFKGAHVFALKRFLDWSTRFYFANLVEYLILVTVVVAMQQQQQQQHASATTATPGVTEEEETLIATKMMSLSLSQKILASLVGGFLSCCCTTPLDALVARIQDAKRAGSSSSNSSMWQLLRQEFFVQQQHLDRHDYARASTSDDGYSDQHLAVDDDDDDPAAADTNNKSKSTNGMGSMGVEASASAESSSSSSSSYSHHASFYRGFLARVLHVSLTTVGTLTVIVIYRR
jgi:Mitochondrial carrier protein